jgi:hypothetical protein
MCNPSCCLAAEPKEFPPASATITSGKCLLPCPTASRIPSLGGVKAAEGREAGLLAGNSRGGQGCREGGRRHQPASAHLGGVPRFESSAAHAPSAEADHKRVTARRWVAPGQASQSGEGAH